MITKLEEVQKVIDRAKVINGLEKLYENSGCVVAYDRGCEGCPYKKGYGCCGQVVKDARDLLKAQEPIAPIQDDNESWDGDWYRCGACGYLFGIGQKYCPDCGRAVKWGNG